MVRALHVSVKGSEITGLPQARQFSSPQAVALTEAYLVASDLRKSLSNMKALIDHYPADDADTEERIIAEALFRDAIVQFAGCVGDAAPLINENRAAKGKGEDIDAIHYLQDFRDSYAAHRFGPLKQCVIAVIAETDRFIFTYAQLYFSIPTLDILNEYVNLIQSAITEAESNCLAFEKVVTHELASMGYDKIQQIPILKARSPGLDEIKVSRSAFLA
jgi:hypothetical protein